MTVLKVWVKYHFGQIGIFSFELSFYENMSMQYVAIFKGCNNNICWMKKKDIFFIFAQNIDVY